MTDPKVSIVMPVHNGSIYLKDAVSDLLKQSFTGFELICIDDGSTDKSLKVLEYFAQNDNRIKIHSQENQGAGKSRNIGMDLANGEYLLFLDADDRFELDLLEKTVERAEETSADIVVYDARGFDTWSGLVYEEQWLQKEIIPSKPVFDHRDIPNDIFLFTPSCVWNKLYRRDFIKKAGLQFQNYPYMNDVYFALISLAMAERTAVVDEVLLWYRKGREVSISSASSKSIKPGCAFTVLKDARKKLDELGLFDSVKKSFANHAIGIINSHMKACTSDNYHLFQKELNAEFLSAVGIDALEKDDYVWNGYEKEMTTLREKGFTSFLVEYSQKLHEIMNSQRNDYIQKAIEAWKPEYFFDIGRIPKGSSTILYGAGFRGKWIHQMILKTGKYNLVGWVDKRGAEKSEELDISAPGIISETDFDYIIIAVDDIDVFSEIRSGLLNKGITGKSIIW